MICNGLIEFTGMYKLFYSSIHLLSNSEEGPLAPSESITVSVAISLLKSRSLKTENRKQLFRMSDCTLRSY